MAIEVTHTPGPWTATGWNNLVVNAANGATLVTAPGGSTHAELAELRANAALIAAAPELLAALENVLDTLTWAKGEGGATFRYAAEDLTASTSLASRALAKAKGL